MDNPKDYLKPYSHKNICYKEICSLQEQKLMALAKNPKNAAFKAIIDSLPKFESRRQIFSEDCVHIGDKEELTSTQFMNIKKAIETFIPWKKGPFNFFGIEIDAEWRSDLKWQRLAPYLGDLEGAKIADIGCHNGYYMFRMLPYKPEIVIGFEPYSKLKFNFDLLQRFTHSPSLKFQLLGIEDINLYPKFFDKIFCLGILYHHPNPICLLENLHKALRRGGELFIDCQGIAGSEHVALCPRGRYAQARGVWFLPTLTCLQNWLVRTRFREITCLFQGPLLADEQRRTALAPFDSLAEFLDPNDSNKTKEGYPAPWRFYLRAKR